MEAFSFRKLDRKVVTNGIYERKLAVAILARLFPPLPVTIKKWGRAVPDLHPTGPLLGTCIWGDLFWASNGEHATFCPPELGKGLLGKPP